MASFTDMPYDAQTARTIEKRWQKYWKESQTFRVEIDEEREKLYILDMFPYPSGTGLHVGHPKGYITTDVLSRYKRMRGFNVLHTMGWDAFGLPAEQYAIETGTHPRETTKANIETYRRQLVALGLSYDWSREIDTTDPSYVRWTQWIFQKLYARGLAYEEEVPVNWCPVLGTVLANEEVIDGKSERGGHPVNRQPMRQWMLKLTDYADRLLDDLEGLDWPESIKKMQRDWIGRSEGARIRFEVSNTDLFIDVFTTRPDTLFGATYMVLAPDHELVEQITTRKCSQDVENYSEVASRKSERVRIADTSKKTGTFTGAFVTNPATGQEIPVWIADYVLSGYGTGAIMAVPAHDDRDYAFAKAYDLPMVEVVSGGDTAKAAFVGNGRSINSGFLNTLETDAAKSSMINWLEENDFGEGTVSYKLRDWLFARQRYWGEPFPLLHLVDGTVKLVPEEELPVLLPELDDYKPSGNFETPLSRAEEWITTTDSKTGQPARRDANTMPQWAGSCWYFLRYCDPNNDEDLISREAERYWMPVDLYVGGAEHAVLHLLYARFWHKVLYDLEIVHTKEPFQKLLNPGMILGRSYRYYDDNVTDENRQTVSRYSPSQVKIEVERAIHGETRQEVKARYLRSDQIEHDVEGLPIHPEFPDIQLEEVTEKMSKSRGNVVSPDEIIERFGADSMRLYELFMGPLEKGAPWSTDGIPGCFRFLQRAHRLIVDENGMKPELSQGSGTNEQERLTARMVSGVTSDLERLQPNTAISKLMVWLRDINKNSPLPEEGASAFARLLSPFAPHLAEEIWRTLGNESSVALSSWPTIDETLLTSETIRLAVQVNGKRRDEIEVNATASETDIRERALMTEGVVRYLGEGEPSRIIIVPGRLVNIVL